MVEVPKGSREQQFPTFLAPRTGFLEDSFSWTGLRGWFWDDSNTSPLLWTVFQLLLYQLHLTSLDIRFWRLGAPGLEEGWAPPKGLERVIEGSWSVSCIVLVLRFLLSDSWWSNIRKMCSLLMCANQFRKDMFPGEVVSDLRCSGFHLRNRPLLCVL